MTAALTPEQRIEALMDVVDDYAEARHVFGHRTYNQKTELARKKVAQRIEALEAELAACKRDAAKHRFLNVTCSQCGRNFGPGNFGFSRCEDHTGESYNLGIDDAAKWLDKRADDYDSEHGITRPWHRCDG